MNRKPLTSFFSKSQRRSITPVVGGLKLYRGSPLQKNKSKFLSKQFFHKAQPVVPILKIHQRREIEKRSNFQDKFLGTPDSHKIENNILNDYRNEIGERIVSSDKIQFFTNEKLKLLHKERTWTSRERCGKVKFLMRGKQYGERIPYKFTQRILSSRNQVSRVFDTNEIFNTMNGVIKK